MVFAAFATAFLCVAACLSAWGAWDAQAQESVSPSSGVGHLGLSWSLGGFSLALVANDSTPRRATSYPVVVGVAECSSVVAAAGALFGVVTDELDLEYVVRMQLSRADGSPVRPAPEC